MYAPCVFMLTTMLAVIGCQSVNDWRYGNGACSVHQRQMNTVQVHRINGGCILFVPGYLEAKEKRFPNPGIEYGPEMYSREVGLIYVCPDCEAARKLWHR